MLGDWPWMVGLYFKRSPARPFCGATLINKQWLLTASHCFGAAKSNRIKPSDLIVRLAEHDVTKEEGHEVVRGVSMIIRHEKYAKGSYDNDIALLKLSLPVKYNQLVKPVCLPPQGQINKKDSMAFVTGWGRQREYGKKADILQEARVPMLDHYTCWSALKNYGTYTTNMICAGYKKGGIDACQGDSGGPLVYRKGGRFELAGVVSWGSGCGEANRYGAYTRVSNYINWIKKQIKN